MESRHWQLNDRAWLSREYLERDRTLDGLAAEIGCSAWTVGAHLRRHGLHKHARIDNAWLRRRYLDEGSTVADIAAELGVERQVILRALHRHGIPVDRRDPRRIEQLHEGDWLAEQLAAGRSHQAIADELGCSRSAVSMAVKRRLS